MNAFEEKDLRLDAGAGFHGSCAAFRPTLSIFPGYFCMDGPMFTEIVAEFELLKALTSRPSNVLSRDRLLRSITHRKWDPGDRTVDVLVQRLRRKLEVDTRHPEMIVTCRGEGYMFAEEVIED